MRKLILIYSIAGGISIALVTLLIIFTITKSSPKPSNQQPTKEVQALMQSANDKNEEAKKLLSNEKSTVEDQKKAKQLMQETLDDAVKATKRQPKSAQAWFFLSQVYKELSGINPKNIPLAEDALKKAIDLNPENAKLFQELSTIYIMESKLQEAKNTLQIAIQLDPNDANGYYKLGNVYKAMNEKEKAKEAYLQAKKLTPTENQQNNTLIDYQLKSLEK